MRRNGKAICGAALMAAWAGASCGFAAENAAVERIAFGSCLHQDRPAPIWEAVNAAQPDVWIWLGDNIYGDTDDGAKLAADYAKVSAHPGYARLKSSSAVIGTWDDHDYGKNNAGKEWHGKAAAQAALLDFLEEPADSPRRQQEGVYWSHDYGSGERKVKVLLLDVRSHRDDPKAPGGDLFGEAQRAWIESELTESGAALTVIVSGTQVIPEDHRYEKWAQFPDSREWFFRTLAEREVGPVVFLSGDRHIAELSRLAIPGREQPLYEVTSSSLTHAWETFPGEPNRHRVGEVYADENFGMLEIDWEARTVRASVRDAQGAVVRELAFSL